MYYFSQAESLTQFGREKFLTGLDPLILRWALAVTILSAVADRFGLWGPPGAVNIGWGNSSRFVAYTAKANSFLPGAIAPELAIAATVAELVLVLALFLSVWPRLVAWATCGLKVHPPGHAENAEAT